MTAMRASLQGSPAQNGMMNYGSVSQFDQSKSRQWDNKVQGDGFGQKFVIALCRRSLSTEEDMFLDESDKKN